MSDVQELINAVQAAGVTLRTNGTNLVISPASKIPGVLKDKLREHKVEILRRLDLEASLCRLEMADIRVALFVTEVDARLQVFERAIRNDTEASQALAEGAVIYTPKDMLAYIQLEPHERRLLHSFKRRFGGTVEWRKP